MKIVATLDEYWKVGKKERRFYCIGEELLHTYPTQDNGEPLIDVLAYFKSHGATLLYEAPKEIVEIKQPLLLRETPAKLLLKAAQKLPEGYRFLVSEGYRPLWYQKQIFAEIFAEMKKDHPEWTERQVWEETGNPGE